MPKFYPSDIKDIEKRIPSYWKKKQAEKIVYNSLTSLSDSWTIIHGADIHAKAPPKTKAALQEYAGDLESDFILIHPKWGILFMEVKGGKLYLEEGEWIQENLGGKEKGKKNKLRQSPVTQAKKSMHAHRDYLQLTIPSKDQPHNWHVYMGHCVAFPRMEVGDQDISPETRRALTIDQNDLLDIEKKIVDICMHWDNHRNRLGPQLVKLVEESFRPTKAFSKKQKIYSNNKVKTLKDEIFMLTEGQYSILGSLEFHKRVPIFGSAGTGKTVLAIEKARMLANQGLDVLLTCYNTPLAKWIEADLKGTGVVVKNFHRLCEELLDEAGLLSELTQSDDYHRDDLPDHLPTAAEILGVKFDAIIVDEGQDFFPHWYEALEYMLKSSSDGYFYIFADSRQDVWRTGCSIPEDYGIPFLLTENVRNSQEIAQKVATIYDDSTTAIGPEGIEPVFKSIPKVTDATITSKYQPVATELIKTLIELHEAGNPKQEIVILCEWADIGELQDAMRVIAKSYGEQTNKKEKSKNPTEKIIGNPQFESVRRFKGLESNIIILVLPISDELSIGELRERCYVGMSRANAILIVIGTKQQKILISWGKSTKLGPTTDHF